MFRRIQAERDAAVGAQQASESYEASLKVWVKQGLQDPRIKVLVGLRGTKKSEILQAIRRRVLSSGVDASRVVLIDFEDARFRRFKTASYVMDYLGEFPQSKEVNYLFLDEVGMIYWHSELLRRLSGNRHWNVWVAASTSHALLLPRGQKGASSLMVYRAWNDPMMVRSRTELSRVWCQIFMRDVVSGIAHPDICAKEQLAEYYSDHLGEIRSLREVRKGLQGAGRAPAIASIRMYRQALVNAYLIEFSKVYDVFAGMVVESLSGRAFYTDLELRAWRFGSAPTDEAARLALNRLYLELRRKYDVVYTPRDEDADFVTLDPNGRPHFWSVPDESLDEVKKFRGGGVIAEISVNVRYFRVLYLGGQSPLTVIPRFWLDGNRYSPASAILRIVLSRRKGITPTVMMPSSEMRGAELPLMTTIFRKKSPERRKGSSSWFRFSSDGSA